MKKTLIGLCLLFIAGSAMSQFDASQLSIGLNGNYTMYKGDFRQSTPGVQLRLGYDITEKTAAYLAFNYGFPIKTASTINYSNGTSSVSGASTMKYNFKTITLNANYHLIGDNVQGFSLLGGFGASYVMVNYEETPNTTPPAGYIAQDQVEKSNESGFTINLVLGAQYKTGSLTPFFETGFSFPANQQNGVYVENVIPAHMVINAGVKFSLGSSNR
jgi:hypothetical protein